MRMRVKMVAGPARVSAFGRCWVLGCDISDSSVWISKHRKLPFEYEEGCRLIYELGETGEVWNADQRYAGTGFWTPAAAKLVHRSNRSKALTVMVVGNADAGKTTFSLFLANYSIAAGIVPCIIDSDVGQGELAPPGSIGSVVLTRPTIDLGKIAVEPQ